MTIKTPYKSEVIEEIKIDTSVIDGKVDIVDTSLDTLLSRLTASRAGYLDNINNSNLATLPAISSARIGYLDNINNSELLNITSTILGRIDTSISSRSSHSASDIWSVATRALTDKANFSLSTTGIDAIRKSVCLTGDTASSIGKILFDLNARLTSTRAGYLDNLSGGAVALNSTVAKEATLTHATYGLDKIKTETASLVSKVDVVDGIVDSIVAKTNLIGASVAPADEYDTEMARITGNVALEASLTAIKGTGWTTETLKAIYDSIGGLNDITAASVWSVGTRSLTDKANFTLSTTGIDNIRKSVCLTGDTANSIGKILYDFSNVRLSATRCGYIDYLASGTYGLSALKTLIDTVDSVADAIKLKTDLLFSGIATEAKQNTIIGYIDTEVGAIKAKTDLIGASVATAGEYTSALSTIDAYFDVTTADATTDATIRDVVGRKTDTANTTVGTTSSLMRYTKGILGLLTNGTYGLSALETLVDDLEGRLTATRAGYLDYLANGTYGLSALNTDLDSIISSLGSATYGLSALNTDLDSIISSLANATYGLSAIKTSINAIPTTAMRGTDNAALASVWTSTRAGYIDYLANGTYGLAAIKTQTGEIYSFLSGYLNQAVKTTSSPTFAGLTLSKATGTSPLTISSTTVCTNLNADMLDGYHSSSFFNTIYYILGGDNVCLSNDTERSTTSISFIKLKEITLQSGLQTTIKTYFELKRGGTSQVYGRIYKDGVALGIERNTNSIEYLAFTEDLDFSGGTLYQVYGKGGGGTSKYACIRNQRILGAISVIKAQITEGY